MLSVEVSGKYCVPPADIHFNDVLGVPDFKLTGLIFKAYLPFPNETNRTRMYNFRSC